MNGALSAIRPAVVSAASLLLWAGATAIHAAGESLTVDFAGDKGPVTYRASGFLHPFAESCWGSPQPCPLDSSTASTRPPASLVDPLKIRMVRLGWSWYLGMADGESRAYARAKSIGATVQLVLSDFVAPGKTVYWNSVLPDTTEWRTFVTNVARQAKEKGWTLQWDLWNEPNLNPQPITQQQYYDIWRIGFKALRSVDPGAVVVGPSVAGFYAGGGVDFMKSFLLYAKANSVLPDVLSWHDWDSPGAIPQHVQDMRDFMNSNGINITRISFNEVIYYGEYPNPGLTVKYFAAMERSGIESAAHACWPDTLGAYNCNNNSLNGLLTIDGTKPRGAWWAYKGYADITGRLAAVTGSYSVDGVVGQDSAKREARGVFGRFAVLTGTDKVDMALRFTNMNSVAYLGRTGKVHVTAHLMPKGHAPLTAPLPVLDATYAVSDNALQFTVPNVGDGEAFTVRLTPEGGTAVAAHPLPGAAGGVSIDAGRRLHLPARAAGVSVRFYSVCGRLLSGFRSHVDEGRAMDLGPLLQKAGGVAVAHVVCYDAGGRGISDAALLIGQAK